MSVFKRWNGTQWVTIGPGVTSARIDDINNMIAPIYETTKTYNVGDYVVQSDKLYKCINQINIPQAWYSGDWREVKLGQDVTELRNDVIIVSDIQPISENNRIWVKPDNNDMKIPLVEDVMMLPNPNDYGENDQIPRSTGTGIEWVYYGTPSDQQTENAINAWLNTHPEATTTVQDNSLTYKKLVNGTLGFVTPEMFGAYGDGEHDDSIAIQQAIDSGLNVIFNNKIYLCSNIQIRTPIIIKGTGSTLLKIPNTIEINSYSSFTEDTLIFKIISNDVIIDNIGFDANCNFYLNKYQWDINAKFSSFGIRISDVNNITVRNCRIDNVKDSGIQVTHNCSNIFIYNNIIGKLGFSGCFSRGIQCLYSPEPKVANYHIYNNCIYNSGEHGIVVYYNNQHVIISNNIIKEAGILDTNPDGSDSYTAGMCIKLSGCGDSIISNNICINGYGGGILSSATDHDVENVQIINNQILYTNNAVVRYYGISIGSRSTGTIVANNIIKNILISQNFSRVGGINNGGENTLIQSNYIENCDYCIIGSGTKVSILNNRLIGRSQRIINIVYCYDLIISNNYFESITNKIDAIAIDTINNCIINGNLFNNINRAIIARTSGNNINIYGNNFKDVTREIYWVFGTPTNSKIDFVSIV